MLSHLRAGVALSSVKIVSSFAMMFALMLQPAIAADDWFVMRTYSSIGLVQGEGETYGLAVSFVPYSGGEKVLWRMAAGRLEPPILLNADRQGSSIFVVVPAGHEGAGRWKIVEQKGVAIAQGPNDLVFKMIRK